VDAAALPRLGELIAARLAPGGDPWTQARKETRLRYFGPDDPAGATARFLAVIADLADRRDALLARADPAQATGSSGQASSR
jgi:hypothetical protein